MKKHSTFRFKNWLAAALFFMPLFLFSQTENCTNGLDDDGDGLIDCFDPDCECIGPCASFYYQTCQIPCTYHPPCDSISLGVQWESTADVGNYPCIVAGDLDKDGIPDIVAPRSDSSNLFVLDGKTGAIKWEVNTNTTFVGGTAPAIADVDGDGFGEIFVVGKDRFLRRYSYNGFLQFIGNQPVGYDKGFETPTISIADFDYDGTPEILIGNQIFSSSNGNLLASGGPGLSRGEHPARAGNYSFCSTVAMDVLPDSFCPDCAGLEIVAGNQVLSVNLTTGVIQKVTQAPAAYSDGYTSVADFDKDGDLDAIVQGRKNGFNHCYVWDLQTGTVIRDFQLFNNFFDGASRVNVANYDADGDLEVSFIGYPRLYCLDNNFQVKWTKNVIDPSSVTCSSVFDFCGDGSVDIVYRSALTLAVFEGATGQIKWQTPCNSYTHIENPLILDVDNDGQTEIVTTCSNGVGNGGHVVVYESLNTPGISSRKVWNQHGYFVTNINDDLSVPRVQQNPSLVGNKLILNGFMNQYFDYRFAAPDLELTFNSLSCDRDSLDLTLSVCNIGYKDLAVGSPVSFYKNNPQTTAAPLLFKKNLPFGLPKDSCKTFVWRIPAIYNDSIFMVANDDGSKARPFKLIGDFPSTTLGECHFENNIASFFKKLTPPPLNLGKDTLICDNATLLLNAAGQDYASWLWQNGTTASTFLAPDAGLFSVKITDICGFTQTDSIQIKIDSSTVVRLGSDRQICLGDTVKIGQNGFDFYKWQPAAWAECATCATTVFHAPATGKISLEASLSNGCVSRDTLALTVRDTFFQKRDTTICYGKTVKFNGIFIEPDSSKTFPFQTQFGCDSTIRIAVHGTVVGTYNYQLDTSVCLGKTLIFNGLNIPPNGSHLFKLKTYLGCDSIFTVKNLPLDTFRTEENRTICSGETSLIFGQNIGASGTYKMVFNAKNGCDSTHLVHLTVLPPIQLSFETITSCPHEATGEIHTTASGANGPFSYKWGVPFVPNKADLVAVSGGNYPLTVTDSKGCTAAATATVGSFPDILFEVKTTDPLCFGDKNGQIELKTADSTLVWSLNHEAFEQDTLFENLGAGQFSLVAEDVNGCTASEVVFLTDPPQLLLQLPDDATLKLGDSIPVFLETNSTDSLIFEWNPMRWLDCYDCPQPTARPFEDVHFSLKITDQNGCTATDDWFIKVETAPDIFLPNALKIEGQLGNDSWQIFAGPAVERVRWLRIFDRWGNLVHEATNFPIGANSAKWDGKTRGKSVNSGVFVVIAELELVDGRVVQVQTDLTVVR